MGFITRAVSALALSLLAGSLPGRAAEPGPGNADLDTLIQRMEESGALDAALERALRRLVERQKQAQQQQQDAQQQQRIAAAQNARKVDARRDRIHGNPQAAVSLIVYTDLECPYCKRFAGTPEQAITKFDGKANVVLRHFPLESHGDMALRGARYAECAGRQAGAKGFYLFVNSWFRHTATNGQGPEGGTARVRDLARSAGVKDMSALDKCVADPQVARLVAEDLSDGNQSGINGTPGVIVRNNQSGQSLPLSGAVPAEVLEQFIGQALSK